MQVYKAFFKVIYQNLSQLLIYIGVFLFLAVILAISNPSPADTDFTETKIKMAFINYDANSNLVEGLQKYLGQNADFIDIADVDEKLRDALFFREVEYIVKVPKGFTDGFLSGKAIQLKKTSLPGSTSEIYMDGLINKYLNTVKVYIDNLNDLSREQLLAYVEHDLAKKTDVRLNNIVSANEVSISQKCALYYNYLAYSLLAALILGVSAVMIVFNNADLKKRNLCSPITLWNINFQMIVGNLSYGVITWLVMIFASFIMFGGFMFTGRGALFLLNSFVFTLVALSISYLIGNIINNANAATGVANVFSLGTSFISGVFVPQAFLGATVLSIASFTPTYWYVKSNNSIADLASLNMVNLGSVFLNMLIMIGFAVAVLAVTMVVTKQKSRGR